MIISKNPEQCWTDIKTPRGELFTQTKWINYTLFVLITDRGNLLASYDQGISFEILSNCWYEKFTRKAIIFLISWAWHQDWYYINGNRILIPDNSKKRYWGRKFCEVLVNSLKG